MYVFLCVYDFWSQRSLTLIWLLLLLLSLLLLLLLWLWLLWSCWGFIGALGQRKVSQKLPSPRKLLAGFLGQMQQTFHIFVSFWCFGFEEWMVHVTVPLNSGSGACARGRDVWSQLDSKGRIESWLVSAFSKYRQRNVGKKCSKQWNKVVIRQFGRDVCPMCTLRKTIHVTVAG